MKKSEQGFTLIELLISVTIALIISAAIFGIYANSAGTSAATTAPPTACGSTARTAPPPPC